MKHHIIGRCALTCFVALSGAASAALTFTSGFSGATYHTHSNSDSVIGFDWGSDGKAYYATDSSFTSGGLYRKDGASSTVVVAANPSLFAGASVVSIGSKVFFNDSDLGNQYIRTYDISTSTLTSTTVTNYALGADGINLLTTGASWPDPTSLLYYAGGSLSSPVNLGSVAGASGPVALDAMGNLFYAPGFGDARIFKWTNTQLTTAISGGAQLSAGSASIFWDYSGITSYMDHGASSITIDSDGNLFVTLTKFLDDSFLVRLNSTGSVNDLVASSDGRLGGLNFHDGQLYVASGNQILNVIPEPSTVLISLLGFGVMLRRKR